MLCFAQAKEVGSEIQTEKGENKKYHQSLRCDIGPATWMVWNWGIETKKVREKRE